MSDKDNEFRCQQSSPSSPSRTSSPSSSPITSSPAPRTSSHSFTPRSSPPSSPPGVSPPPLTKIVRKVPSTPREFFAKLYEPDTVTHKHPDKEGQSSPQIEEKFSSPLSSPLPSFPLQYLPSFPLPSQELGGMVKVENFNMAFPAGLAAFCKYSKT